MSQTFTAKQICEKALRKIGAFSINDSAADNEELAEALSWLDLIAAEQAGSTSCFWLVPSTASMTLTGGTASYDIETILGTNSPTDGIQFPVSATLKDSNGNETPLKITTRTEYEEIIDKDQEGIPDRIYIDRLQTPTLKTFPVLTTGTTGYTIELVLQTFTDTFHGTNGAQVTGYRQPWQLWMIYALTDVLGDGTIRRVPASEAKMYAAKAEKYEGRVLAFENRQFANTTQRTAFRDF